jgi:ribose 5-phosphate isomerase B
LRVLTRHAKIDRRRPDGRAPFSCDFISQQRHVDSGAFVIVIGSDHGGVELKDLLVQKLRSNGVEVEDLGTHGSDSVDYPDFGRLVALKVAKGEAQRGILLCTNGIGMSMVANKFPGVRAALVHELKGARMSREHNNSNILVLGGGMTDPATAERILDIWLETPFAGERHQRRIDKIAAIERELGTQIENEVATKKQGKLGR